MKNVRFDDSKLKLETEAPTAGFCSAFICGRTYTSQNKYTLPYFCNYCNPFQSPQLSHVIKMFKTDYQPFQIDKSLNYLICCIIYIILYN